MATKTPDLLERSLGWTISRVSHLLRREVMRVLADYELTPEQFQVLAALWEREEPRTQSELAQITLKDRHTLSRMIDRMETAGWVRREAHPTDERAYLLFPTRQALRVKDRLPAEIQAHFRPIWEALGASERRALHDGLHKLLAILEE